MKVSQEKYYVYIVTNKTRSVLYIGVTNDLPQRLVEHFLNEGKRDSFAGKYRCHSLIYYEEFKYITDAIGREKELKKWSRDKKHKLIESLNPNWETLNAELFDQWPPKELFHRKDI